MWMLRAKSLIVTADNVIEFPQGLLSLHQVPLAKTILFCGVKQGWFIIQATRCTPLSSACQCSCKFLLLLHLGLYLLVSNLSDPLCCSALSPHPITTTGVKPLKAEDAGTLMTPGMQTP